MIKAQVQVFSIKLESFFERPKTFSKEQFDGIVGWLADPADGFSLRSDQVRARITDVVFDYELVASFYGGNAKFQRDAEKFALSAQGARTQNDADLLRETASRFSRFVTSTDPLPIVFSASAHCLLPSLESLGLFLEGIRPDPRVINPGILGYAQVEGWSEDVRVLIEPSFSSPQSLFFSWQTTLKSSEDWPRTFNDLVAAIAKATGIYGVEFDTLAAV